MGRNIWQSDNPVPMIKAVRAIVHSNYTAEQAYQLFTKLCNESKTVSKKPFKPNQNNKSKKPFKPNQNNKSKKPFKPNQNNKSKKPSKPDQKKN
jgi:putative autoinducer-2 (AI-2) aldolase